MKSHNWCHFFPSFFLFCFFFASKETFGTFDPSWGSWISSFASIPRFKRFGHFPFWHSSLNFRYSSRSFFDLSVCSNQLKWMSTQTAFLKATSPGVGFPEWANQVWYDSWAWWYLTQVSQAALVFGCFWINITKKIKNGLSVYEKILLFPPQPFIIKKSLSFSKKSHLPRYNGSIDRVVSKKLSARHNFRLGWSSRFGRSDKYAVCFEIGLEKSAYLQRWGQEGSFELPIQWPSQHLIAGVAFAPFFGGFGRVPIASVLPQFHELSSVSLD